MKNFLGAFFGAVVGVFAVFTVAGVIDLKRSPVAPAGATDGLTGDGSDGKSER